MFWPGAWRGGGAGWWNDEDVEYSLEAITLKDEVEAELAMVQVRVYAISMTCDYNEGRHDRQEGTY